MRNLTGGELVSVYGGGYSWGYCPPPPCNYGGGSNNKGSKKGSKKKGSKNKGSKGR